MCGVQICFCPSNSSLAGAIGEDLEGISVFFGPDDKVGKKGLQLLHLNYISDLTVNQIWDSKVL